MYIKLDNDTWEKYINEYFSLENKISIKQFCKDSKSKKYMWLYMSQTEDKPVTLYDYQSTRSSSCPKNFLKDYKGYLQTDGYS